MDQPAMVQRAIVLTPYMFFSRVLLEPYKIKSPLCRLAEGLPKVADNTFLRVAKCWQSLSKEQQQVWERHANVLKLSYDRPPEIPVSVVAKYMPLIDEQIFHNSTFRATYPENYPIPPTYLAGLKIVRFVKMYHCRRQLRLRCRLAALRAPCLQELRSLPPMYCFPGGTDYLNALVRWSERT